MPKESFMMHMMQCKLDISESTKVAACHNISIRSFEIFKKAGWLNEGITITVGVCWHARIHLSRPMGKPTICIG